jgi:hypothetical protein
MTFRGRKKRPKGGFGRLKGGSDAYFLALHLGQPAQSVFASAQHCMPQDGLAGAAAQAGLAGQADLLAQHFLEAQPATTAEAQTISARSLMDFIFCL